MQLLREGPHLRVGMAQITHGRRRFVLSRKGGQCMQYPMLNLFVEALVQCLRFCIVDPEELVIQ